MDPCPHKDHLFKVDIYSCTRIRATAHGEMKVVVFGAAGQVGRAVVRNLLSHGHSVRAFERSAAAWAAWEKEDGPVPAEVECVYGDIVSFEAVLAAVQDVNCVVHTAVFFPPTVNAMMPDYEAAGLQGGDDLSNEKIWLVNLKGLWNVLEASKQAEVPRVVHLGSAAARNPSGVFSSSDVRRPDGSLYAVTKRLQEEMCRQFWDAHKLRTIVLRPDYIMDAALGIGRFKEDLPGDICGEDGWVDRNDLAEAVHLCLTSDGAPDFDVLHGG
jgi:nucleoside-diphosphate-sugar epimerase